jgi:ESS family glutamate:Na+ symporter
MIDNADNSVTDFIALTMGIIVFFVGTVLTRRFSFLREYNIPEPVTGGLIAALAALIVYLIYGVGISYNLATRDPLASTPGLMI